jgi:hypothetical protein
MLIENKSTNAKSFLGGIRDQLIREREMLEKKLQEERSKLRGDVNNSYFTSETAAELLNKGRNNYNMKSFNANANMISAMKRYEKFLEKSRRTMLASERANEERAMTVSRLAASNAQKRKLATLNTKKFIEQQIKDKVLNFNTNRSYNY